MSATSGYQYNIWRFQWAGGRGRPSRKWVSTTENNWWGDLYNRLKDKNNHNNTYWTSHNVIQRPGEGEKEEGEADRKEERCKKGFLVGHQDSKDFQPNEKFLRILLMAAQPRPRSVAGRTLTRFPPSELTLWREHTFQIENQDWFNMTFVFGRLAHLIALDNPEPHDHLARSGTPWNTWWAHSPGHGS